MDAGRAVADLVGVTAQLPALASSVVCADDLPDGLVVADHAARVTVFNRAATRLTGIPRSAALGADVRQLLPLRDADGRCWWVAADPYHGLSTRTRHPEMSLYLKDGTELLVTVGYVRGPGIPGSTLAAAPGQARSSASWSRCAARSSGQGSSAAAPTCSLPSPTNSGRR